MKSTYKVRNINCECGENLFQADIEWDADSKQLVKVWRCGNCNKLTPRQQRNRKTNAAKVYEGWVALGAEWQPITDELFALSQARNIGGGYYLHNQYR